MEVLLQTYRHSYMYRPTLQRCVITMGKKYQHKLTPPPFRPVSYKTVKYDLVPFHGLCHTRLQVEIGNLFCPLPWQMQATWENWRNSFWGSATPENCREID